MKKAFYIMGSLEIMLGGLLLSLASIVKNTLPTLGRVAFQAAMKGSYSPSEYDVSFPVVTIISVALIVFGVLQVLYGAFKKDGANG